MDLYLRSSHQRSRTHATQRQQPPLWRRCQWRRSGASLFGCRQVESKGSETAGREYSCQHIGRSRCRTEHRSSVPGQRRAARKAKTRGCPGQWEGGTRDGMAATDRTTNKHQTSPNRQYILTPCHRHVAIARRGGSGSVGAEHTSRPTRLVGWVRCGSPWRGCPQVNLQAAGATQTPSPLCDPAAFRVSPCTCRYGAERRWWRSRTAQPRLVFCVARPPSIWEYKRYEETQTRLNARDSVGQNALFTRVEPSLPRSVSVRG